MVGKNDVGHGSLVDEVVNKSVRGKYVALVDGNIGDDDGSVDGSRNG
ncbi:hypothetical protein [Staphylococcus saprophyticus]